MQQVKSGTDPDGVFTALLNSSSLVALGHEVHQESLPALLSPEYQLEPVIS